MYVSVGEYFATDIDRLIPKEELPKWLKKAEADIDSLTYNRVLQRGFDNLTDYQKKTLKWAVCEHANFLFENDDMLTSALTSYSINGVSMGFDSAAMVRINGVTVSNRVYSLLLSTNLMYGGLR